MSTFSATFRETVVPALRSECRLQALSLARGRCDFSEAYDAVFLTARERGALHLPDNVLLDLEGWLATTILRTIEDIEARPEAAREIVDEVLGAGWPTTR